MEYVNDPELAPGQTALAARRQTAGTAFAWAPGNEIDAFLAFVGTDHFAVVDGKLYKRQDDGMLAPFDVTKPQIVLKPMAGDTVFLTPDEFKQGYTMVVAPPADDVWLSMPTTPEEAAALIAQVSGVTDLMRGPGPVPQDASSESPAVDAADEASAPPLLAPGEGTPARKPGRPKGSTNKATS